MIGATGAFSLCIVGLCSVTLYPNTVYAGTKTIPDSACAHT